MKKITLILILNLVVTTSAFSQKCECFDFTWKGDTVSGRYIANIAINIPVTIDNLSYEFDMQFDLGAVTSVFYGNSIEPYLKLHSKLRNKIDSTKIFYIQGEKNVKFKGVQLKLGKINYGKRDIGLFSGFGDTLTVDSVKTNAIKHIGTIAPDLFQDKILIIDYPKTQICVTNKILKKYRKINYQDFVLESGRIKIPLEINGNREMLLFDTGSSMFSLITTKSNANQISNKIVADSLRITSWGEYHRIFGNKVTSDVKFANRKLPPTLVYYFEKPIFDDFFEQEKIWGIAGNAYFSKNILIIDYKNKKLGMK